MKKPKIIIRSDKFETLNNILAEIHERIGTSSIGGGKLIISGIYNAMRIRTGQRSENVP